MSPVACALLLTLLVADRSYVTAAPFRAELTGGVSEGQTDTQIGNKSDLTVEQLEKLKSAETGDDGEQARSGNPESHGMHLEMHRFDASVKQDGELVSRVSGQSAAAAEGAGPARVLAAAELHVPAAGVHRVLVQDGERVSVHDQPPQPQPPHDAQKETKVFHGAARLVQPSSVAGDSPPAPPVSSPQHTTTHNGNRRAFNADITRETNGNVDHFSSYTGVQYSPLDMAEYVFWTGDERGVTAAIEEFLQEGVMSKDEAISFLQEIKFNIDYLKAHYSQQVQEDGAQQERMRTLLMEQAAAKEMYSQMQYRNRMPLQSFPFGSSADILRSIASGNYELSNSLAPAPARSLPLADYAPEPVKRTNDPMLQTNIIGTSDYDREGAALLSEEEYEQAMDKLRAADSLYTQYTLEEVIYQLAKMMFAQALSREPVESRRAMQRFMSFLELEAQRGQLSRTIEKQVLDVMIAALSDTVAERPELAQSSSAPLAAAAASPADRLMRHVFDAGATGPNIARAILAAHTDELAQKLRGFPAGN